MTNQFNNLEEYLYALVASPDFNNDSTLFAAKSSGLYRSTNRGRNWSSAYQALGLKSPLPTTAVAFSPNFTDDQTVFAAVEGNVLRSNDGGDTWAYVQLAEPVPLISTLVISPMFASDGLLLAGTLDDGIVRSTNRSATWHRWNFGLLDPHINALHFAPDMSIYAGVESGVFRSVNKGRSWREVDFPMDLAPVISLGVAKEAIFVGTEENGLHISTDTGETWERIAPDLIEGAVNQILITDSEVAAILDEGIFSSSDGGRSWESWVELDVESTISSIAAPSGLKPGSPLWVGMSGGDIIKI